MNLVKINDVFSIINSLSKEEKDLLIYKLSLKEEVGLNVPINKDIIKCNNCKSIKVHKHDMRNNKQRYKCYDCEKTFVEKTNGQFAYLHTSHISKFKKFAECMVNYLSLRRSAEICGISLSCAFKWRHKIFSSLRKKSQNNKVSGLIEMDDIYFRKSAKGMRNVINPRKHGYSPNYEDKAGLSKDKICITTSVDRNKNVVFDFVGMGKPSANELFKAYQGKVVDPEHSKFIVDGETSYKPFVKKMGASIKVLKRSKNMSKKLPVIDGNFHIQNVNNLHSQIKNVINDRFKGVSSSYLLKYINFVVWMRTNKDHFYVMVDKIISG